MFYDRKLTIFGLSSLSLTDNEKYLLKNSNNIFGIILFARNVANKAQLKSLIQEIRAYKPNLNILIDEEGGRVTRLSNIYPQSLTAAEELGDLYLKDPLKAKAKIVSTYKIMANRLTELGINIICAPVADLAHKNTHAVIGNRAFSNDKHVVIECCKIAADTLLKHNVTPIIKHMPGHGRANCDSHLELPIITDDLHNLAQNDFAVFKALNKYPLAMTAHIIYNSLDNEMPITLSKKAMAYVRNIIGFKGKIMTDDINMHALKQFSLAEIIKLALTAGCDYILHCNGNYQEMAEIDELLNMFNYE